MTLHRYRRRLLVLGIVVSAALFLVPVSNPVPSVEGVETDKLAHLLVVGGLGVLVWWNLPAGRWRTLSAILLASVYAGLIELVQRVLVFRSGDAIDFVAGVAGATVFVAAAEFIRRRPAKS
jgi:VanZ family protein